MFRLGWTLNFLPLSLSLTQLLIEPKFKIQAGPRVGQAGPIQPMNTPVRVGGKVG